MDALERQRRLDLIEGLKALADTMPPALSRRLREVASLARNWHPDTARRSARAAELLNEGFKRADAGDQSMLAAMQREKVCAPDLALAADALTHFAELWDRPEVVDQETTHV